MSISITQEITKNSSTKNQLKNEFELKALTYTNLYEQGRYEDALVEVLSSNKKYNKIAGYHNILGKIQQALNNLETGIESFKKAVEIQPDFYEAYNNLGVAYLRIGRTDSAYSAYRKAIDINPTYAECYNNIGLYWSKLGDFNEALKNFSITLKLRPNLPEAYNNVATIFMKIRRTPDAVDMLKKALQLKPFFAEAHNNLGNAHKSLGRFEAATKSYQRALESKPLFAEALFNLTQINEFSEDDPILKKMYIKLNDPESSQNDRMLLSFSLGKTFDDINKPAIAYKYFTDANEIRRSFISYNLAHDIDLVARIKKYFFDLPSIKPDENNFIHRTYNKPIFIVGMPRSGTTLVEQILSSHPDVFAAGELSILGELANNVDFKKSYHHINLVKEIRKPYLAYLDKLEKRAVNVVDKMPLNFFWVGLIISTIPEARIIHVKRDARATCWSIYKQLFIESGTEFSYNFEDLIGFYKLYIDLMKFWHQKFPNKIYDLNYDFLTNNQEVATRGLLNHIELEFSQSCLDFHTTERQIDTASAKQVRQKMYKESSNSWLKYKKHLSYLLRSLEDY